MIRSKSLICEVYSANARFGLGNVAENGAVDFREFSRDIFGNQIHGRNGNPTGRNTFRYADGIVDWSDGHPPQEVKHIIETWLERKGYPFKKHISYFDRFGPPDDTIDEEGYSDKLSDDERDILAQTYFDIGHDNNEDEFGATVDSTNYCWIWNKGTQTIDAKKGGTHSSHFGVGRKDYTFSGWYDEAKNKISIVFPDYMTREIGNRRPTVDDIPQQVYQKLISKFGKRKPTFVVFESIMKNKKLKFIIKQILREAMFPKEFDRNRKGSCMAAAELATKYLLKKGVKDFQIVEGWVAFSDDWDLESRGDGKYYEYGDVYSHTWIEFSGGRTFDPTKKQWKEWGYDPEDAKVVKVKTKYTPEEYLEACEWEPSDWQKFKKMTEIRLEPPVDVTIRETVKVRDEKQKQQLIKNLIPRLKDDNVIISVSKYDEVPAASYVQVDFIIKGQNILSTNPENMIRNGFRMPTTQQLLTLDTGKYKISDLKGKLTENMTYDQLLKLTADTPRSPDDNTNRIDRAKNVRARSIPVSVEEGKERWNFRYKSNPSVTNKPFEGQITFLKGDVERKDNAMELECKVDCGCPDYRYKFAYNNFKQGAGDIGPDSLNKCINRSPQPAYDIGEGLCKHLTALRGYLQTKISSTRKSNLFEAINEVAQQGPFNITYYD